MTPEVEKEKARIRGKILKACAGEDMNITLLAFESAGKILRAANRKRIYAIIDNIRIMTKR